MKFLILSLFLLTQIVSASTSGPYDRLVLRPSTPPTSCRDGLFVVDSGDSNKFKKCQSGVFATIGESGIISETGSPTLNFIDLDTTDDDVSAKIIVNCTDLGSGTEDCDLNITHQVAGSDVIKLTFDASENLSIFNDVSGAKVTFPTENQAIVFGTTNLVSGIGSTDGETIKVYSSGGNKFQATPNGTQFLDSIQAIVTGTTSNVSIAIGRANTNDNDNGFMSSAINEIQLINGGSETVEFDSTSVDFTVPIIAPAGLVGTPSISFVSDTNTGIFNNSAGMIQFTSDGTEAFRILSTQITPLKTVRGIVGTKTIPTYSFDGDTDTGIYNNGAGQLRFTSNDTSTLDINSVSVLPRVVVRGVAGAQAAPAYSFDTDTDSGMWSEGANAVAIGAGNTRAVTMNSTAFIPRLPVRGTAGTVSLPAYSFDTDTDTGIFSDTADQLELATGGTTVAFIDASQDFFLPVISNTTAQINLQIDASTGLVTKLTSSARYKKNIKDSTIDSSRIYNLRVVEYDYRSDGSHDFGLIAEEVIVEVPELVIKADDPETESKELVPEAVKYGQLPLLILQELKKIRKRVEHLEKENIELKNIIDYQHAEGF